MLVLTIVLVAFLLLELGNVFMLSLSPGSKRAHGMGVFNAYDKSREDPAVFALVTCLINWVAETKLIFIVLLIGIVITGNLATKFFSVIALISSILTFFSRLYPTIRRMDEARQITPHGYSRTLGIMIASFVGVFASAAVVFLVFFRPA